MGRSGGNPLVVQYRFKSDRDEPLTEQITVRINLADFEKIQSKPDPREFVRQAIVEALKSQEIGVETPDNDQKTKQRGKTEKITIRLPASIYLRLINMIDPPYRNFVRQAITRALEPSN